MTVGSAKTIQITRGHIMAVEQRERFAQIRKDTDSILPKKKLPIRNLN
jgi:hypothetical protein